jgi:uncharacterized protein
MRHVNKSAPRTRRVAAAGVIATLLAAVLHLGGAAPALAQEPQALATIPLEAGFHRITAQLARTPDQRQIGLMFRKTMPDHEGMLFVFDEPTVQCFWMKNTLLPLSAAFLRDDGSIVNVVDMQPQTLDSHCSKEPVRYVLEMNQGWFAKRGLGPGKKLGGEPFGKKR